MPIIKSAKKALKQSVKKHSRNEHFKNLYKETRKAFEAAIKAGDVEAARTVLLNVKNEGKTVKSGLQSNIDKLVKKNIIHKNNGDRKKSKYATMLKNLETSLKA
ncbi:MAG: 30S ribosomal protein S20 [Candidatus Gracilibacteria bacterium]|nr:30S ribosomal protein S20 [Candidatus Gracilibacteria bacterium]